MDIPPAPLSIEVSITVEQIFEIVEMDYTFEVPLESSKPVSEGAKTVLLETLVWLAQAKFRLMLSWHDESIFRLCNGVDPWATPAACPEVWRPDVVFLNAKEIEMIGDSAEFWAMEPGWAGQMGIEGGIGTSPTYFMSMLWQTQPSSAEVSCRNVAQMAKPAPVCDRDGVPSRALLWGVHGADGLPRLPARHAAAPDLAVSRATPRVYSDAEACANNSRGKSALLDNVHVSMASLRVS